MRQLHDIFTGLQLAFKRNACAAIADGGKLGLESGMAEAPFLKIKLQILCGDEIAMGPGKADLLDAIAHEGSISAAGRALGMSYRRAWLLVDAMNRCWREPLVATMPGGAARGGARLTPFGQEILRRYRMLQKQAGRMRDGAHWAALEQDILPTPKKR